MGLSLNYSYPPKRQFRKGPVLYNNEPNFQLKAQMAHSLIMDPSIQIIPTLGPEVCKYYLH